MCEYDVTDTDRANCSKSLNHLEIKGHNTRGSMLKVCRQPSENVCVHTKSSLFLTILYINISLGSNYSSLEDYQTTIPKQRLASSFLILCHSDSICISRLVLLRVKVLSHLFP